MGRVCEEAHQLYTGFGDTGAPETRSNNRHGQADLTMCRSNVFSHPANVVHAGRKVPPNIGRATG